MTLLTKATINRPVTFESHPPVGNALVSWNQCDQRADPVHHAMARPLHWFMQEHFYEKPRNVFMQIDAYKFKMPF
jgi:hypothetical protein